MTVVYQTTRGATWRYSVVATLFGHGVMVLGAITFFFSRNRFIVVDHGRNLDSCSDEINSVFRRDSYSTRAVGNKYTTAGFVGRSRAI